MTSIRNPCHDCGQETNPHEYYMVHWNVWRQAKKKPGERLHYLCIGCLELRLGRQLTGADFTDCPLNKMQAKGDDPDGARLRARLLA